MKRFLLYQGRFGPETPEYVYINPDFVISARQRDRAVELQLSTGLIYHIAGTVDKIVYQLFPNYDSQEVQK